MLRRNFTIFLIFFIVGFTLYAGILDSFFISDDFDWMVSRDIPIFFRPLVRLTFIINYEIGGLNPVTYHVTNLLLHILNACLLFLIVPLLLEHYKIGGPDSRWLSFLTALFFLTLSAHSESVTWISGRTNLFALAFLLFSLYFYLHFRRNKGRRYLIISLVFFFLALLSKEAALTFPFIVIMLDYFQKLKLKKKGLPDLNTFSFFLVLLIYFILRYFAIGHLLGGYSSDFLNVKLIIDNLRKLTLRSFLPSGDYLFFIMRYKLDLIFLVLLGLFLWREKGKAIFFCFLLFALFFTLVPVLNLDISLINTINERFTYLASVFSAVVLVMLINLFTKKKSLTVIVIFIIMALNIFSLFKANYNWRRAGEISKSILYSFRDRFEVMNTGNQNLLFILNLPDNINGAYIFRRGFINSIKLFFKKDLKKRVVGVCTHTLQSEDDRFNVDHLGNGLYYLHIGENRFLQNPVPSLPPLYEIRRFKTNEFLLQLKQDVKNCLIFYYANMRLNLLDSPPWEAVRE